MPELALWLPFLFFVALIGWMYHVIAHRPGGQPIGALEAALRQDRQADRQARAAPPPAASAAA